MMTDSPGFEVIAREAGFVVVDKAPGLDFHDCDGSPGLCSLVRERLGERVFPVHRLDKATSGLVLLAGSREWAGVLAGLLVLYAALNSAADERRFELAVMRALGASRQQLRAALLAKLAAIGGLAGLIAALGAQVYLLEYTQDAELINDIDQYCAQHGFVYMVADSIALDGA